MEEFPGLERARAVLADPAADPMSRLDALVHMTKAGEGITSYEQILPILLSHKRKPYSLKEHFYFRQLYDRHVPSVICLKTARQVGKSQAIASRGLIHAITNPTTATLFVTPLFEQIRRFSANYMRPLVEESPIKPLLISASSVTSVLQKSYLNGANQYFSFAFLDADRTRGLPASEVYIDECQGIDPSFLDVIRATTGASRHPRFGYTGTPLTMDNVLQGEWEKSSMAEFFIKCDTGGCNEWNIASTEFHLLAMIGPAHRGIGPDCAGVVCHKCQKPLRPRTGQWLHRKPHLIGDNEGYHVPQPICPVHFEEYEKWRLIAAANGGSMPVNVYFNEVLGESYDVGAKLVTEADLVGACTLGFRNTPAWPTPAIIQRRDRYLATALGIDWGGGGEKGTSFTAAAHCGITSDGVIDVMWGRRLMNPNDDAREAADIIAIHAELKPYLFAHDFNGAGAVHETLLVSMGLELARIVPMAYNRATSGPMVKYVPKDDYTRAHYRIDKVRTLLTVINAIKFGKMRFFDYDKVEAGNVDDRPEDRGLLGDFLSLVEEKMPTSSGGDTYTIRKSRAGTDDFAHAVCFAATALWHSQGKFPDFGDVLKTRGMVGQSTSLELGPEDVNWRRGDY